MLLEITGLSNEGQGVGHLADGRVAFVSGALPGDTVQAELVSGKNDYVRARTLEIVKPSPDRVASVCPFRCGGCPLICMSYRAQLEFRQRTFERELRRVAPSVKIDEPVFSDQFGYRSRARFRYCLDGGKGRLGFYEENTNTDVPITSCAVADGPLNAFIENPPHLNVWELKDRQLSCITTDNGVLYDSGTGTITVRAAGREHVFPVTNNVFFQSNLLLLPALIEEVVGAVEGSSIMDLYSGVGTFSAFVEDIGRVTAVEMNRSCLALARMHLSNTRFFTSPVERWKPSVSRVDTIIVDPPRTGLEKSVPALVSSFGAGRLIYVSCCLPTLVRDLGRLQAHGWTVERARFFDFYPNTVHVEAVCLLVLRNPVMHVNIDVDVEELVQDKRGAATYEQIRDYVKEQTGLHVTNLNIAQIKRKCGIIKRQNYNLPKSEDSKQPNCTKEKKDAIMEAFKHFGLL